MKSNIFFLICIMFFLNSCQSLKDGLSGKKNENSDEFLVEKKNPLEIPPSYGNLPEPKKENKEDLVETIDEDIEKLIEGVSQKKKIIKSSDNKSAEDFVLKQIQNN